MIINEKRLARALKSAGAVGFRLRVAGPNLELIGPDWAAQICLDIMDEPGAVWRWIESRDWLGDTEGGREGGGACA